MTASPPTYRTIVLLVLVLPLVALALAHQPSPTQPAAMPIKNVVVLMLENRAFDHMCGYLKVRALP